MCQEFLESLLNFKQPISEFFECGSHVSFHLPTGRIWEQQSVVDEVEMLCGANFVNLEVSHLNKVVDLVDVNSDPFFTILAPNESTQPEDFRNGIISGGA